MRLLLKAMAPDDDDLECLGEDNGDTVWLQLTFVTGKYDPQSMPLLSPTLKETFVDIIPTLRGWRACVDSFTHLSQMQK